MGWHSSAAAGWGSLDSGATDGDAVLSGYLAGRWGMEGCSGARAASCVSSEVTREEPISLPRKPTQVVCPAGKSPWQCPCRERRAGLSEGAPRAMAHRRSSPCVPRHFLSSAFGLSPWPKPCSGTERGQGRVRAQEAVGK